MCVASSAYEEEARRIQGVGIQVLVYWVLVYRVLVCKPEGKRLLGRPRRG